MGFIDKLSGAVKKNSSLVCIGLDSDPALVPAGISVLEFNRAIIDSTSDLVCAYKLNFAFYEAMDGGWEILQQTAKHVPEYIPVIGDAKRGDIGNTAQAYARAIFDKLGFDATTVNPYFGFDSVEPFTSYRDRGVFILCRTSNQGAVDFQNLQVETEQGRVLMYQFVARKAAEWNKSGNIGLVVGSTYPEELKVIREAHPDIPLLIPGIGAQGGDLALTVKYGTDRKGEGAIITSSRQIIYVSKGTDFARAARQSALSLKEKINDFRSALK